MSSEITADKRHVFHGLLSKNAWGFAFHRAWITSYIILFNVSATPITRDTIAVDNYTFSLLVLIIVLLCGGFLGKRLGDLLPKRWMIIISMFLTAFGTLCLFGARNIPDIATICAIVSNLATGIGSGILIMQWGQVYSAQTELNAQAQTATAFGMGAILYAFILILPADICILVGSFLPIASGTMLYLIHEKDQMPLFSQEEPLEMKSSLFRVALAAAAIGLVGGVISGIARMNHLKLGLSLFAISPITNFSTLFLALSVILTSLIILICVFKLKESKIGVVYRWVLLFLAGGGLLLFAASVDQGISLTLGMMGRDCFELIFWVTLANLSYRYHLDSTRVFGFGRAGWAAGPLLSELVISNVLWLHNPNSDLVFFVVISCLLLILVTYLFILPERNVERITEVEAGAQKHKFASFRERCSILVKRYSLTPREAEVLGYLIRGRDTLFIQNKLYISAGTVSTHRQRIYSKIGVHSRQELIDVFESIVTEDLPAS